MKQIFRTVESKEDWTRLTAERVNDGWFFDLDQTQPVAAQIADRAGEDIYTQFGWNVEPTAYPVLASIDLD